MREDTPRFGNECKRVHYRHTKKTVYMTSNKENRRSNKGNVHHKRSKTAKTVTGGGISAFSPSREVQEDRREEEAVTT